MARVIYTTSQNDKDLQGILDLQQRNLPVNLSPDEMRSQGFVTVMHTIDDLRKMNNIEQHVIAKDRDHVGAYLLAMTKLSRHDIPVLVPMFDIFDNLVVGGQTLAGLNFIVIGQACVGKEYRGQGVFDGCYSHYKEVFKSKYDFAVTEIATKNTRSLQAHKRVGFKSIHKYIAPDTEEWDIVLLEW